MKPQITLEHCCSSYSVDSNNKFLSGDGYTMSNYDGDGNPQTVTTKAGLTLSLTYNQEDVVTQIQGLGSTNTFVYDGDGRRVSKTDSSGTTSFVYDGSSVIAEIGASVTTYRLPGVGEPNSVSGQSDEIADQLGSTMAEVSASATFLGQYSDDGYGIESDLNGRPSHQSAFRFAGKHGCFTEEDSHMVLCGARYYIPILGRSLTQDPNGHDGGLNLYGYCGEQNPLKATHASGVNLRYNLLLTNGAGADILRKVRRSTPFLFTGNEAAQHGWLPEEQQRVNSRQQMHRSRQPWSCVAALVS